jgi:hypothetical protein
MTTMRNREIDYTDLPDPLVWDGLEEPVLSYLSDQQDPRFKDAMKRKCEVCGAAKGRPCWNTIDSEKPLPNRLIHHARVCA